MGMSENINLRIQDPFLLGSLIGCPARSAALCGVLPPQEKRVLYFRKGKSRWGEILNY